MNNLNFVLLVSSLSVPDFEQGFVNMDTLPINKELQV